MFCDEHGTADYCGECVYGPEIEALGQLLAVSQAENARLREALTHIKRVMGPKVPPCCDGCAAEWQETLDTVNTALAGEGGF